LVRVLAGGPGGEARPPETSQEEPGAALAGGIFRIHVPRAACAASTSHEPPLAPDARHLLHAATAAKPSARPVQRDARQARPGGRQSHPQRDHHAPVRVRHLTAPRPGRRTLVGCGARPCCPGAREGTPTQGAARTAARRLGITQKQLRAIVGSATSRSPKTPKTRPRGPLPRRGPPGCPRRGLPPGLGTAVLSDAIGHAARRPLCCSAYHRRMLTTAGSSGDGD